MTKAAARIPPGPLTQRALALFVRSHVALYRVSGGRLFGTLGGAPLLLLTTTGRRSGKERTVPLIYVPGPDPILVASNGGAKRHPLWYLNAKANPAVDVQIGRDRFRALVEVVEGAEREAAWSRAVAIYPPYGSYQAGTNRELPVVALRAAWRTGC
ncbi:MAG TPA: nitroreductase family deazaflavin-dependent oxidoreductase [Geminicoccaceae bacterium]